MSQNFKNMLWVTGIKEKDIEGKQSVNGMYTDIDDCVLKEDILKHATKG